MSNSHLQFALILIRARQSNTSPQSINLCRRLLCFVGATLRLRLCSWLWVFLSVSSVHWRLVLRTLGWVTGYQLSRGVWTKTPATWSEHLCAQGGADGPGPANCGGSGDCWSGLELELGCCVKVVWPGCCCLSVHWSPLHCTALLHCHSTPGHYCTTRNLQSALQMSTSLLRLVLMMFFSHFTSFFLRCSCI